ncbi:MAG TPA: hypothetical protein VMT39_01555 [Candidatus Bathyarchaeia archaeon]|nr:hypothetical protein [Candidatus Bathyarchaeia archaeon]
MKIGFGLMLPVLLVLCCTCAVTQTDTGAGDTGAPTQPGPKPAYTYPDATPSLDFLNGAVENSSITLGIGAGVSYQSYGYSNTANGSQDRVLFHIAPSIKIQQYFPRLSWNFSYAGGWQTYTHPSHVNTGNDNLFSQNASAGILWQMARRWQLSAKDTFVYSANPFDSYVTVLGTPTMNNPNPTSYYPLTRFTTNSGVLALTDQLSKADTLAFTGTANLRRTSTYNQVTSVPFYNLVSYGGLASYAHRFSPRLTLGANYDYNSLDFGHGQQRSGIQSMQMTVDYLLRPNLSISGWVGPQYTATKTVVGIPIFGQIFYFTQHSSLWTTSAGVNVGWQSLRNSVRAGYSHQVQDGGGYIATSQVNSVNGSYRRMLTAKLDGLLSGTYYHNASTTESSRTYSNYYINAGLNYKFTKSLNAIAQYTYSELQKSKAFVLGAPGYTDNIVGVTVNYSWTHPLGR